MPPHSCAVPGRNPGTSTKVTSGMLNASQVRTKRAALAAEPGEGADDVLRVVFVHLEQLAVVDDALDHMLDVVRLRRIVGDDRVEVGALAVARIGRLGERR